MLQLGMRVHRGASSLVALDWFSVADQRDIIARAFQFELGSRDEFSRTVDRATRGGYLIGEFDTEYARRIPRTDVLFAWMVGKVKVPLDYVIGVTLEFSVVVEQFWDDPFGWFYAISEPRRVGAIELNQIGSADSTARRRTSDIFPDLNEFCSPRTFPAFRKKERNVERYAGRRVRCGIFSGSIGLRFGQASLAFF